MQKRIQKTTWIFSIFLILVVINTFSFAGAYPVYPDVNVVHPVDEDIKLGRKVKGNLISLKYDDTNYYEVEGYFWSGYDYKFEVEFYQNLDVVFFQVIDVDLAGSTMKICLDYNTGDDVCHQIELEDGEFYTFDLDDSRRLKLISFSDSGSIFDGCSLELDYCCGVSW